jgi:hypothetical protein
MGLLGRGQAVGRCCTSREGTVDGLACSLFAGRQQVGVGPSAHHRRLPRRGREVGEQDPPVSRRKALLLKRAVPCLDVRRANTSKPSVPEVGVDVDAKARLGGLAGGLVKRLTGEPLAGVPAQADSSCLWVDVGPGLQAGATVVLTGRARSVPFTADFAVLRGQPRGAPLPPTRGTYLVHV